jgi:hypothetical protein
MITRRNNNTTKPIFAYLGTLGDFGPPFLRGNIVVPGVWSVNAYSSSEKLLKTKKIGAKFFFCFSFRS